MNGIDLILEDHERVNELFARFEETGDATLIGQIVDALTAHDQAEHAALYPLAGALLDDPDSLERYSRAHSMVKKVIEHLWGLEGEPLVAEVAVLRAAVTDHVAEEENELLPALTKAATYEQLEGLGARIEQVKQRVG
jgi:hemerythrin superfamily protein